LPNELRTVNAVGEDTTELTAVADIVNTSTTGQGSQDGYVSVDDDCGGGK
jgi:hypothetical protein